jgi:hypothetical protein
VVTGIFPIDPTPAAPTTTAGTIHFAAGLVLSLTGTLYPLLLTLRFRRDEQWKPFFRSVLPLAIAQLAVSIVGWAIFVAELPWIGIGQRAGQALTTAWLIWTALNLRSIADKRPLA